MASAKGQPGSSWCAAIQRPQAKTLLHVGQLLDHLGCPAIPHLLLDVCLVGWQHSRAYQQPLFLLHLRQIPRMKSLELSFVPSLFAPERIHLRLLHPSSGPRRHSRFGCQTPSGPGEPLPHPRSVGADSDVDESMAQGEGTLKRWAHNPQSGKRSSRFPWAEKGYHSHVPNANLGLQLSDNLHYILGSTCIGPASTFCRQNTQGSGFENWRLHLKYSMPLYTRIIRYLTRLLTPQPDERKFEQSFTMGISARQIQTGQHTFLPDAVTIAILLNKQEASQRSTKQIITEQHHHSTSYNHSNQDQHQWTSATSRRTLWCNGGAMKLICWHRYRITHCIASIMASKAQPRDRDVNTQMQLCSSSQTQTVLR